MTRSIGRRHRIGMLAALGVAVAAISLVSGCSAGQIAETALIVPAVPGGSATVKFNTPANPNAAVLIANGLVVASANGYKAGTDAPLQLRIINQTPGVITVTPGTVTLQAPTARAGASEAVIGTLAWVSSAVPVVAPSPSTPPASAPPSVSPSGSPSNSASGAPSSSPSESPAPPPAPALKDLKIQPGAAGLLILTPAAAQFLAITNLTQPLKPGDIVNVTLTFTDASGQSKSGTVAMPIAPPATAASRAPVGTSTD